MKYVVKELKWERLYLHILCAKEDVVEPHLYIQDAKGQHTALDAEVIQHEKDVEFIINITHAIGRNLIDKGHYTFVLKNEENTFMPLVVNYEMSKELPSFTRVFYYGNETYCYNMSFQVLPTEKDLLLELVCTFMMENDDYRKRRVFVGSSHIKDVVKKCVICVVQDVISLTYHIATKVLPRNGKRILLMSENHTNLSENLAALDKRMRERGMDQEYQISYCLVNLLSDQMNIIGWIKTTLMMANKDYIFIDDYTPILTFLDLDKRTKLIQVWHAGVGFKCVGYSRFGKPGGPHPTNICHKKYDYAIVASTKVIPDFAEKFGIEKEAFIPYGLPRLDGYLDEEKIRTFQTQFYEEHPDFIGKKIVLFAPTFRGKSQSVAYYDYDQIDFDDLASYCEQTNSIVLFKMHPFVQAPIPIPDAYQKYMFDYTKYPSINQLFYVVDLLITDYSSNIFEFSMFHRPMLFYAYDKEFYEVSRGLYRGLDDIAPGKVCRTFEELMEAMRSEDFQMEKLDRFIDISFDEVGGCASDKIIDIIFYGKDVKQ